jgi:phosphatidylinositol phosphate synthase
MRPAIFIILFAFLFSPAVSGQSNNSAEKESTLPNGRPGHYITPPKTERSLFFIQRNMNQNTIVYDANLKSDGSFDGKPVDVYWRRYATTGERRGLKWLERTFAYGYSAKKDKKGNGYWATLTAYDERKIHLQKAPDGKPVATMTIGRKYCQLECIWVFADNSGTWPKVKHVDLHGKNMITGEAVFERILN